MKPLLPLLAVVTLLSFGASACGGAGKSGEPVSHVSSSAAAASGAATRSAIAADTASERRYLNDDDGDIGGAGENSGYRDADDGTSFSYAHTANAADEQTIAATVKRYYAIAAAGDGQRACSMLMPSLVRAVPLDYGRLGPPYLRGAKTCRTVLALLFRHLHSGLSAPIAVTGVLVDGDHAYALLGSAKTPAGYITLQREHGAWKIAVLLGGGMP
jgi:ketosteroid isomerase-like protein